MREFPSKFQSKNLELFTQYKYERDICYLREAIYEYYICETTDKPYETPFDIQKFVSERNPPRITEMLKAICEELEKLGWKTFIGHNNSSLWVYNGKPPKSLPDW